MKPKRIISLLLAICLVAGLMPTVAFATGSNKAIMLGTEHLQGGQPTTSISGITHRLTVPETRKNLSSGGC